MGLKVLTLSLLDLSGNQPHPEAGGHTLISIKAGVI